jgi:hypothetical protein
MRETLQNIYLGPATTIKNKTYFSTRQYVEPFINAISDFASRHICEVKVADQLEGNGSRAIYNRVLVISVCNDEYDFIVNGRSFHRTICMSYSLDTKKPLCKFYTGVVDPDLNFYAFGDDCMHIQEIEPENAIDYSFVQAVFQNGLRDNCQQMLEQLVTVPVSNSPDTLGHWVDFAIKKEYYNEAGKVRMAVTLPVEVYKTVTMDQDSEFYFDGEEIPMFNVLQSFSYFINNDDKDLNNRYEKIQLVNKLLGL